MSSTAAPTNVSASPLLLPPKPPTRIADTTTTKNVDELSSDEVLGEISVQKEQVLKILKAGVAELSTSNQSVVATKLKLLEADWSQCDVEIIKLLVELSKCKFLNFSVVVVVFLQLLFNLDVEEKDAKSAAGVHRKIVLKGCNKQWLHAIRQIVMHMETQSETSENMLPSNE